MPPPLTGRFATLDTYANNAQIQLDGAGLKKLGDKGTGISGAFGRLAAYAGRSDAEKLANKAVTKAFVQQIKADYGKYAAKAILDDVRSSYESGGPLSVGRVKNILVKADDARKKLTADMTQAGFTPAEIAVAQKYGVSLEACKEYQKAGVPLHERTLTSGYAGKFVRGTPVPLSGGAVSKPYRVQYADRQGVGTHEGVYKQAGGKDGLCDAAPDSGIPRENPRLAARSIATKVMDEALGSSLIPRTEMGAVNGKLGLVQAWTTGVQGRGSKTEYIPTDGQRHKQLLDSYKADPENFFAPGIKVETPPDVPSIRFSEATSVTKGHNMQDPDIRKGLIGLQILDALTGEVDRHPGNFIITPDLTTGRPKVSGIDNDNAFGDKYINFARSRGQFPGLPPVIDTDMETRIMALTPEKIRQDLGGLLTDAEVEAAVGRLTKLKEHVGALKDQAKIIAPGEWGGAKASGLLRADPRARFQSSYVATLDADQRNRTGMPFEVPPRAVVADPLPIPVMPQPQPQPQPLPTVVSVGPTTVPTPVISGDVPPIVVTREPTTL